MQEDLKKVIKRIMDMYYIVQREGLLALEKFISQEPEFREKYFVTKAVRYICDGISQEKTYALLNNRIHMEKDFERHWYKWIYMNGLVSIQRGESVFLLKETILSLVPVLFLVLLVRLILRFLPVLIYLLLWEFLVPVLLFLIYFLRLRKA